MGVEKNLCDSRLTKTNSVDLYRPPALRNHNHTEVAEANSVAVGAAFSSSSSTSNTTTTSISCNNSPIHCNENSSFDNDSVTSTNNASGTATALSRDTATTSNGQQQRQQTARRERRPDRAVYIPRARRSQTTPPTTTTTAAMQSQATITAITTTTMSNNVCSNQQLAITSDTPQTALVATAPSAKTDESVRSASSKKSKSIGNTKERKERVKKTPAKLAEPSGSTETTVVLIQTSRETQAQAENSKATSPADCDSDPQGNTDASRKKDVSSPPKTTDSLEKLRIVEPISSAVQATNEMNSSVSESGRKAKRAVLEVVDVPNLRIEDAVAKENAPKYDIDVQELQRASKEINRSNRRIIKQTFVSDVLEIPDKIEQNSRPKVKASKTLAPSRNATIDSTTEEEEEDDWETMFDESGECLDPKIMQELTASVGKVKIELPKMDYSAYLTKQSILNDEEFPHVLEVSGFPVEFKNQDLLMVFSQYKESGFDIKWVDDTHALAVFSSSRIAAEVLSMGHPFVVLKPLAEATVESRLKAKKCAASLQPYRPRPETCAALARRLVTGALGVRLKTAAAERENEKRVLREAKERKLLAAKQRDEIWES